MPPDAQDLIDSSTGGAPPQVVTNVPSSEEAATKAAIAEVLAADKAEAEKTAEAEKKAAEEKKAKESETAAKENTEEEEQAEEDEADPQAQVDEAAKKEAEAKKEADEKAKKEAEEKTAAEAAKEAAKKRDIELAERMSKLAQAERKMQKEREETKAKLSESETKVKTAEAEAARYKAIIDALETNPMKAFRLAGKDFNKSLQRAKRIMDNPQVTLQEELDAKEQAIRADFDKKLSDERAAREKEKKEQQEQQRAAFEEQDRHNTVLTITKHVADAGEKYELIRAEGREREIALELYAHWKETGEVVPLDEYLTHVENELETKVKEKLLKTSKAKKWLVPAATAAAVKAKEEAAKAAESEKDEDEKDDEPVEKTIEREKKKMKKSLTNASSTRAAPPPKPKRETTGDVWKDARAEALEYLNSQE